MPGSPQGQGQTDNPTRNITFKGEEAKQKKTQKEKVKGKHPFVLHQLVAFCAPKSRLLQLVFFLPPLLHFKEFQHSS